MAESPDENIRLSDSDVEVGVALPWSTFDDTGRLLLRKGAVISSQNQLNALLQRGMYRQKTGSLNTGLGDCEDYAIAKYVALREAGVAAGDLRLLLVRDNAVRMAHAVLAAHQDGHWLILDNRWTRLIEDTELKQFMPLFALGEHGVKLFAAPYAANRPMAGHDLAMNESEQSIPVGTDTPAADRALVTDGKGTGSLPLLL